jgi:hypothetical protein
MKNNELVLVQGKIVKYYFWLIYFIGWPLSLFFIIGSLITFDFNNQNEVVVAIFFMLPVSIFCIALTYFAPKYQVSSINLDEQKITLIYNYGYFEKVKEFDLSIKEISFFPLDRTSTIESEFHIKKDGEEHKFQVLEGLELNSKLAEYDFYSDPDLTIAQKLCKVFELIQANRL